MKAYIENDWAMGTVKVYLVEGVAHRRLVRCVGADEWESIDLRDGQRLDMPSLTFTPEALEAIVREASGVLPPTDATTRHLEDTIKVRDRLLDQVAPSLPSSEQVQ